MASVIQLFRRKSGEKDAFKTLLRPHIELMYAMAYRWTHNQVDAEDLVQSVLTTLATRVDEMQRIDDLQPWLLRIVYRRYVDAYRKKQRTPEDSESSLLVNEDPSTSPIGQTADSDDAIERLQLQQALQHGLDQLDDDQRNCILLHDMEGYTATETAEILDIQPGTVKSRLHRARQKLKKYLPEGTF